MLSVNNLLKKIFIRSSVSIALVLTNYFLTKRLGDAFLYLYKYEYNYASNFRTDFTRGLFGLFLPIFSKYGSLIVIGILANVLLYISLKKYLKENKILIWNLILFLPSLLIYTTIPSKEFLFFIAATNYIVLECEHLFNKAPYKKNKFLIFVPKYLLLVFMILMRGALSFPYTILAIFLVLIKTINFNHINLKKINLTRIFLIAITISLVSNYFVSLFFPSFFNEAIDGLYYTFIVGDGSFFSRSIPQDTFNFVNPINLIWFSFLSLFPTINQILTKPVALIILFDSTILVYAFIQVWIYLFDSIRKDNYAKFVFSSILIIIISSYLLIYGFIGYFNIGAAQRFRANIIPISLFMPLVSCELIRKKKEALYNQNKKINRSF